MQVVSPSSTPPAKCIADGRFSELSGKLSEDFGSKLNMDGWGVGEEEEEEERHNLEKSVESGGETDKEEEDEEGRQHLEKPVESGGETDKEEEDEEEEEEEEEEEFSFACVNTDGSPITAEEAFQDGQIRPVYPLFDRDLLFGFDYTSEADAPALRPPLRKLFVEDHDGGDEDSTAGSEPLGPYCSWSGKTVADSSPESCRKSNSTGFSKLWRFRDLVLRSNSDGRDAFVFLSNGSGDKTQPSSSAREKEKTTKKGKEETTSSEKRKTKEARGKKGKDETASSAHEKLYMRNRAIREEDRRRSYLPYKQVGFFTNVNRLSKNIHPF